MIKTKSILASVFLVLLIVTVCSCSSKGDASGGRDNNVVMRNYNFEPGEIVIKTGESVTWLNRDQTKHKLVGTNFKMESDSLLTDESFTHRFDKAGKFTYQCRMHPRMQGTVVVE